MGIIQKMCWSRFIFDYKAAQSGNTTIKYLCGRAHIPVKIFCDMNTMFEMNSDCFDYQSMSNCFVFQAKESNICRLHLLRCKDLLLSKWIVFGFWTVLDETLGSGKLWRAFFMICDKIVPIDKLHLTSIVTGGCEDCNQKNILQWASTPIRTVWNMIKVQGGEVQHHRQACAYTSVKVHANFFAFGSYSEDVIWKKIVNDVF